LYSYGKYGENSPYKYILSESELKEITPDELISLLKTIPSYQQKALYYGPSPVSEITEKLNMNHKVPAAGLQAPPPQHTFEEIPTNDNNVLVVNYDGMVQAEIIFLSKKELYNKEKIPYIAMYNEYFGSGMSGIVFQEIRESKALAYSAFSSFSTPPRKERSHYNASYIGTQADKLPEAMQSMVDLLNEMPESDITFQSARHNLCRKLSPKELLNQES
jgi:predicted Zn-dependent peptidase